MNWQLNPNGQYSPGSTSEDVSGPTQRPDNDSLRQLSRELRGDYSNTAEFPNSNYFGDIAQIVKDIKQKYEQLKEQHPDKSFNALVALALNTEMREISQ